MHFAVQLLKDPRESIRAHAIEKPRLRGVRNPRKAGFTVVSARILSRMHFAVQLLKDPRESIRAHAIEKPRLRGVQ
jgi:hypothetical protein